MNKDYAHSMQDDLISRQAAIKNAHFPMIDDAGYEVVRVDDILALPSEEPKTKCVAQIRINRDDMEDLVNKKVNEIVDKMVESKKGAWGAHGECPFCGYLRQWDNDNFCANCGANMRGNTE